MGKQAGARRSEALKKRRLKAARLFDEGATQADVARRLGVSRVSAMRWYQAWRKNGRDGLGQAKPLGRPSRLSPQELERIEAALLEGPQAHGYSTELWTLPRVAAVVVVPLLPYLAAVEYVGAMGGLPALATHAGEGKGGQAAHGTLLTVARH